MVEGERMLTLGIVDSAQNQQMRRRTQESAASASARRAFGSISEVPEWKPTYRIVFPRTARARTP